MSNNMPRAEFDGPIQFSGNFYPNNTASEAINTCSPAKSVEGASSPVPGVGLPVRQVRDLATERFIRVNEERFGALIDGLGYCATCPGRAEALAILSEVDPVNVPADVIEAGKLAKEQCRLRADVQ